MTSDMHVKAEVSCFRLKGEDFHFIKRLKSAANVLGEHVRIEFSLVGVCDGHGGRKCAEFVSKQV